MTDEELRQQFQAIDQQFKIMAQTMQQGFQAFSTLIENVKDSLEREITQVKQRSDRMETRLDKIAAGTRFVTRLAVWSEKQNHFQADILHRVQVLEDKVDKLRSRSS